MNTSSTDLPSQNRSSASVRKYLICFAAAVLTFFMAGLLYLWCFERVDPLGAYSIPAENGPLSSDPI
jgi:hypothetical protein